MSTSRWWLICYDVRDARRLRKCAKHLEGYGERLQFSVFRCWLNARGLQKLRWELTEILAADDDILFIPLCRNCIDGIISKAEYPEEWPLVPPRFHIV
jgi:CRISPR-associated protein Cas2